MLATTLPYCEGDLVRLALHQPDVHINVSDILGQCAAGTLDRDKARLDLDGNPLGNVQFFGLEDVPHLQ